MAGIVVIAGVAAMLFLLAEKREGASVAAIILSLAFAGIIATLVPRTKVTLSDGGKPVLTIVQRSRFSFPSSTYAVVTPDGKPIGVLRRSALARLGRNRWMIAAPPDQRGVAFAVEESLGRALRRKIVGKFNRKFEADYRIIDHGMPAGEIVRRPDKEGRYDVLQLRTDSSLDRRMAVALATLIFGAEP